MKSKVISLIIGAISILAMKSVLAAWTWTPFMGLTNNYFHPLAQGNTTRHDITLLVDQNFNTCSAEGNYALVNSEIIGEDQFDVLVSIILTAWTTNKPIAILHEGCDGNRARVYGLRIGK